MIEMFGASNESALSKITNLLNTVNRNDTAFNDTVLLSPAVATGGSESSLLLSGFVANATAVAVDNAAQWLATTIANSSSNLIGFNTESTAPVSVPYTYNDSNINYISPSLASSYLNLTNPTTSINNDSNHPTANPTYILSSDLMGGTTELTDDNNIYDSCHPSNPNFNCSRMDYILFLLGPQTMPLYTSLMITILYGGIFITGFLGNILICIVIVKHSAMHTATNYYLFNLAVSDLIYLIFGLPAEVFSYWHQYPYLFGLPFCKARAYISETSTYVSVLTIVAFSVERYLAICHPLHKYALSGFKRALRIIALLWVISFIGAIPFAIWTKINYSYYPPDKSEIKESGFCGFDTPEDIPLFEVSSLIFFFIPMFLLIYFYGRMGAKIYSRTTQKLGVQKGSMHRESRYQQSRKAVIRMLTAVVVTFFICWLPFHIQRLWCVHGNTTKYYQEVNEWLFKITGFAYYVTCTINPILYNVMSHRYRVAFKDILCGFSREQSSFRETTIATTSLCNSTYDRMHSVRIRSVRLVNNVRDRSSINSNNILWKKSDLNMPTEKDIPESHSTNRSATNALVVCVDNGAPGRTKVFTESEAHETLLRKDDETCI